MSKNHFAVLGLTPGASEDEIKKSFRSLAKQWHPDKNKNAGAEEKFKEISASYDYLQSNDRREILARDLNKKKEPKKTESYTPTSSFFNTSTRNTYSETYTSSSKPQSDRKENKDPGKSKKDPHWTSSFFGKNKQKRKPEKKQWSQDWEETPGNKDKDRATPRFERRPPTFSDAFRSFVDHLDTEFEAFFTKPRFGASPFGAFYDSAEPGFDRSDPFADLSTPVPLNPIHGAKKKKPPVRPRNVARESGNVEGLDDEYLFSPRQGQGGSQREYASDDSDLSSDGEFGFDADKAAAHVPCFYCGKVFQAYKLIRHQQSCGKFDDSSSDEKDVFSSYGKSHKSTGDWRQTQAELHEKIRRAKEMARAKAAEENYATVMCKWCGRAFSKQAAERHVPFCERWTKQHGSPTKPAGPSKSDRAKQYAKKVPRPGGKRDDPPPSSWPDSSDDSDEFPPSYSHSPRSQYSQGAGTTTGPAAQSHKPFHRSQKPPYDPEKPTHQSRKPPHQPEKATHQSEKRQSHKPTHQSHTPTHQSHKPTHQSHKPTHQSHTPTHQSPKGAGAHSAFFGISGATLNKKPGAGNHGNEGCATCRKTYGSGAKFACSCGTKKTLR